jgi:hypothetical protein
MESSIMKARENAAKYTSPTIIEPTVENKSTAIATVGATPPAIPENSAELESYIKSAEGLKTAAEAMRDKPGITKEGFEYWDRVSKTCALAALDAALKLSLSIQAIPTARGHRPGEKDISDVETSFEEMAETKKQILEREYKMNEKKAWKLSRLTVLAVDAEKSRARKEDEPVSISKALEFIEKQETSRNGGRKNAAVFAKKDPTKRKPVVLPDGKFNVIYMDLEVARQNPKLNESIVDNAILFLLVDPVDQAKGMECAKYFGFEYKDCAVAMVDKADNQSGYLQSNHRHLIVATKGEFPKPDVWRLPSFGDGIMLGGDSATEYFRKSIKRMYPEGAMLDLIPETIDEQEETEGESNE